MPGRKSTATVHSVNSEVHTPTLCMGFLPNGYRRWWHATSPTLLHGQGCMPECTSFLIFFGVKLRIFSHILVPKKCRVLQLAIRGTFPGLNWVSVPPKLPFVSLCRPMVSCQRHSSLKSFWRCTSDGLLVKDAPICAASNDMQGVVHLGGSKIAARRKLQCAAIFWGVNK